MISQKRVIGIACYAILFFSLCDNPSIGGNRIQTTTDDGKVPSTNITYTIEATGSARAIFQPGSSDSGMWTWSDNFPEFVGTGQQTLTVTFSSPVPLNRIVLGANSFGPSEMTLSVSGGNATP